MTARHACLAALMLALVLALAPATADAAGEGTFGKTGSPSVRLNSTRQIAAITPGQTLIVALHLTATERDYATMCQNEKFGDEARLFGERMIAALGLNASVRPTDDPACVELSPNGPITTPGRRNERVLRLDASALTSLVSDAKYTQAFLVVCTPRLSQRVQVFNGANETVADGCPFIGIGWDATKVVDFEVSFRAGPKEVFRGIAAGASWVIALATLALLAGRTWGRRYHWGLLRARPWLAFIASGIVAGIAAYGWSLVAYQSMLVHALQLSAGIGSRGATVLVTSGSFASAVAVALTAVKISRDSARAFPAPDGSLVALPSEASSAPMQLPAGKDAILPYWPPVTHCHGLTVLALIPALALMVAFLLFALTPKGNEVRVEGMLAVALAYAIAIPMVSQRVLPMLYGATPLNGEHESRLLAAMQRMRSDVTHIWSSPVPPGTFPVGGAILRAGSVAIVWEPALAWPDEELAAAIAVRPARKRTWPAALFGIGLATTLVLARREEINVPTLVLAIPLIVVLVIAMIEIRESVRVRSAARSGDRAADHLRGILRASRMTARLTSGGSLGATRSPMPNVADAIWHRGQRLARSIAMASGMNAEEADQIAMQVIASDSAGLPEIPLPVTDVVVSEEASAPIGSAPIKHPTAKKSATAKKRPPAKKTLIPATKKPVVKKSVAPAKKKAVAKMSAAPAKKKAAAKKSVATATGRARKR